MGSQDAEMSMPWYHETLPLPVVVALVAAVITSLAWILLTSTAAPKSEPLLVDKERYQVVLVEKESLSHDVRRFRFALPSKTMHLGLPICKHVKVFAPNKKGVKQGEWNGSPDPEAERAEIERKYTPTSSNDDKGFFELVLKVYSAGQGSFTDGGKMSQYLDSLTIGSKIQIQGSFGLHTYVGSGKFLNGKKEHTYRNVGMIAGGTGITPMMQLITRILKDPSDPTQIWLLFANKTEDDIFLRDMLDKLLEAYPSRFRCRYTVSTPPANWSHSTGHINEEMVKNYLPPPSEDTGILLCGPPPMIKLACLPNLAKVGHANLMEF